MIKVVSYVDLNKVEVENSDALPLLIERENLF